MKAFKILFILLILCDISYADTSLSQRKDVQEFIQHMHKSHQFNQENLNQLFNNVTIQPSIIKAISRPAEGKPWYKYQQIFASSKRTQQGADFWVAHQEALMRAQEQYGVPAQVIIAVMGVETFYGQHQGGFKVIDALSTLAFDYPPRSKFFRKELEEYLLMTRENHLDPTRLHGSYAGAMGQAQFMPSSYRHYAVDFSGKHKIDLENNTDDAIGSIANYLAKNGWQRNQPTAVRASVNGDKFHKIHRADKKHRKPSITVAEMQQQGILAETILDPQLPALFITLNNADKDEYWLGFNNFYVITRYNPSINYAMMVYTLSEDIRQKYEVDQKA